MIYSNKSNQSIDLWDLLLLTRPKRNLRILLQFSAVIQNESPQNLADLGWRCLNILKLHLHRYVFFFYAEFWAKSDLRAHVFYSSSRRTNLTRPKPHRSSTFWSTGQHVYSASNVCSLVAENETSWANQPAKCWRQCRCRWDCNATADSKPKRVRSVFKCPRFRGSETPKHSNVNVAWVLFKLF